MPLKTRINNTGYTYDSAGNQTSSGSASYNLWSSVLGQPLVSINRGRFMQPDPMGWPELT